MRWEASRDATPDWNLQHTVYDQASKRVATVFGSMENVATITAAPVMLEALRKIVDMHMPPAGGHVSETYLLAKQAVEEVEYAL
jgi:hypothetical protein